MQGIVGVDGCKAGWVAVGERSQKLFVELWPTLEPLLAESWTFACVDIPIGLACAGERRTCDLEARKLLGKQRSSVFFSPPREHIQASEYEQVRSHGMSLQTFYLLPKIREMDELLTPELQKTIKEAHPELAYRSRATQNLEKKKTERGRQQRQAILGSLASPFHLKNWNSRFLRKEVTLDDLMDAAILLEVAREWSSGRGRAVGDAETDSKGLKMEICY